MLLEILKEPILVDGVERVKDVRLNIASNHQMRLKATYLSEGDDDPIDIVVYNWTVPKMEKLSLSISIDGKEMLRNIKFELKLSYDFLRRSWRLKGKFGSNHLNRELAMITDIFLIIQEYL